MSSKAELLGEMQQDTREERVRAAFYGGAELTLGNPAYLKAFCGIADELLRQDTEAGDLTVTAMGIGNQKCKMEIRAKHAGIAAGLAEAQYLYKKAGARVDCAAGDGEPLKAGDILITAAGDAGTLLSLERVAVNLLQRMSGTATATKMFVDLARGARLDAHVVATRKTPWGLLDKRAVHCGGGGTHRLNLGDAILIKTNHLRLSSSMGCDFESALRRAWENRNGAGFFEVEAATHEEALRSARILSELQAADPNCTCILMLDNFPVEKTAALIAALRAGGLREKILVESSGNISETLVAPYAATGVDVISVGALTHSPRALDLSARLIPIASVEVTSR